MFRLIAILILQVFLFVTFIELYQVVKRNFRTIFQVLSTHSQNQASFYSNFRGICKSAYLKYKQCMPPSNSTQFCENAPFLLALILQQEEKTLLHIFFSCSQKECRSCFKNFVIKPCIKCRPTATFFFQVRKLTKPEGIQSPKVTPK